jgi:hypothetical protein
VLGCAKTRYRAVWLQRFPATHRVAEPFSRAVNLTPRSQADRQHLNFYTARLHGRIVRRYRGGLPAPNGRPLWLPETACPTERVKDCFLGLGTKSHHTVADQDCGLKLMTVLIARQFTLSWSASWLRKV